MRRPSRRKKNVATSVRMNPVMNCTALLAVDSAAEVRDSVLSLTQSCPCLSRLFRSFSVRFSGGPSSQLWTLSTPSVTLLAMSSAPAMI